MDGQMPRAQDAHERPPHKTQVGRLVRPFVVLALVVSGIGLKKRVRLREAVHSSPLGSSILKHGRLVFNPGGNKYRLVVWINYPYRVVYIRFIGTHRQYDAIDAQTI
jgi:mRNA-degrading endonuclease HigB of HigAB toxin-antitoxin module